MAEHNNQASYIAKSRALLEVGRRYRWGDGGTTLQSKKLQRMPLHCREAIGPRLSNWLVPKLGVRQQSVHLCQLVPRPILRGNLAMIHEEIAVSPVTSEVSASSTACHEFAPLQPDMTSRTGKEMSFIWSHKAAAIMTSCFSYLLTSLMCCM